MDLDTSVVFMTSNDLVNLLYSTAGIIIILSFLARDILWLRTIFMFASVLSAISGAIAGLYSVIVWDLAYCGIHVIQVAWLLLERKPWLLPARLRDLWEKSFSAMTPGEFKKLWEYGDDKILDDGLLYSKGEKVEDLIYIYDGKVDISSEGKTLASLGDGSFVGEMSFLTSEPASADVKAVGSVRGCAWSQEKLKRLKTKRPKIFRKLIMILGVDLVSKLQSQNQTT